MRWPWRFCRYQMPSGVSSSIIASVHLISMVWGSSQLVSSHLLTFSFHVIWDKSPDTFHQFTHFETIYFNHPHNTHTNHPPIHPINHLGQSHLGTHEIIPQTNQPLHTGNNDFLSFIMAPSHDLHIRTKPPPHCPRWAHIWVSCSPQMSLLLCSQHTFTNLKKKIRAHRASSKATRLFFTK